VPETAQKKTVWTVQAQVLYFNGSLTGRKALLPSQ